MSDQFIKTQSSDVGQETSIPSLGFGRDGTTSHPPDPHAVSDIEAECYYAGILSRPTLLYRTSKEQWVLPRGFQAQFRMKELCEVFTHPISKVWNDDLAWKVVDIMDAHKILFTTIDVVRFKSDPEAPEEGFYDGGKSEDEDVEGEEENEDEETIKVKKPKKPVGPVTIWVGVFPESTSATAAHNAAQDVLSLLNDYQIIDVDIEYRESYYTREVGPQLLQHVDRSDPIVDVVSPLTSTLGLHISTMARPDSQGTMALYLAEGGNSKNLLGLSCRHVLIGPKEANIDYVRHASAPSKDVLLLGKKGFTDFCDLIKYRIWLENHTAEPLREEISGSMDRENGINIADAGKANRIEKLRDAENTMEAFRALLDQVNKDWRKPDNRVLGHVLCSPALRLGVGEHRFTEDWGIFQIDRAKLGDGFQGNKLDMGTKLKPKEFLYKCFTHTNWTINYWDTIDRLLPLDGVITNELMHTPDMWDSHNEPCMLVVKNGSTSGFTLGRANGVFSIVRDYFSDMSIHQTSMEWAIINFDSTKAEVFSEPGDSGSIIADIRGRVGGMLTGSAGKTEFVDITYATPFWWLLERIRANGFPNAHLDVLA